LFSYIDLQNNLFCKERNTEKMDRIEKAFESFNHNFLLKNIKNLSSVGDISFEILIQVMESYKYNV
jgi:hypothetical protein